MTRSDLIQSIVNSGVLLPNEQIDEIVKEVFILMEDALTNGEKIEIRGFGSFVIRTRDSRIGRNPKTGEKIEVSGRKYIHFKPGKELRERLNAKADKDDIDGKDGRDGKNLKKGVKINQIF